MIEEIDTFLKKQKEKDQRREQELKAIQAK